MPEKAEGDKSKSPGITRLARLRKDAKDPDFQPDMPPCDVAFFLIDYLFEIGPCSGEEPVTDFALYMWQRNTGIRLDSWQCRTIRKLSRAHLNESHAATKRNCPAPWRADADIAKEASETARNLEAEMMKLMDL